MCENLTIPMLSDLSRYPLGMDNEYYTQGSNIQTEPLMTASSSCNSVSPTSMMSSLFTEMRLSYHAQNTPPLG